MDVENSLYGDLCQLFLKISEDIKTVGSSKDKGSFFAGTDIEYEAAGKKRAKRNGFHSLYFSHLQDENNTSERNQLHAWMFKLKHTMSVAQVSSIENAIEELDLSGQLENTLPILKFLMNLKPIDDKSTVKLKVVEASEIDSKCSLDLHYQLFGPSTFQVLSENYKSEEPYSQSISKKLKSTQQLDDMDIAHVRLFGALLNPPQTLNYLGISSCSKLVLGIGGSARHELIEQKHLEVYKSPSFNTIPVINATPCDYWEDLENLCDPTPIRRSWEAKLSGEKYAVEESPYLSRAPLNIMEVLCRQYEDNLKLVDDTTPYKEASWMEEAEFQKDLLYLTLGIESKIFIYREDRFNIKGRPAVNGLSPELVMNLVQPCLKCGQLARRLNQANWNPSHGLVRNALADQLLSTLKIHHELMEEAIKCNSLTAVVRHVVSFLPTLRLMDQLWHWPGWSSGNGRSVMFLQHLVHLATATDDDHQQQLLTAYFQACVQPFLTYLQRWMYRGYCCDPQNEFLIRADIDHLAKRDRHYWTKGFALEPIDRIDCGPFVNASIEDDALLGLMGDIYLCGKTVNLLQLCQNQVVENNGPSLRIALNLSELVDMRQACEIYLLKRPANVDFVQKVKNIGREAREVRDAKIAELVAAKQARQLNEAEQRSVRFALAKAELDEQLENKRVETRKREKIEQLLDEDIKEYHETIAKREAKEKKRLILKYARLLSDQPEEPVEDEENANVDPTDEQNNVIDSTPDEPIKTTEVAVIKPILVAKRTSKKKILTREEIRSKVLKEEFGIDPRCTVETELNDSREKPVEIVRYVPKEWNLPNMETYPFRFQFDTPVEDKEENCDWNPSEIRGLSLSFFVHRSLLLPVRTQCQMVNCSLMTLLTGPEHRLMQHLQALREFLFLDNGAFGLSLVSSIGSRLDQLKHINQLINVPSMNFILQTALHAVKANEYFASRLSFYIKDSPQKKASNSQLEALDSFTLRYRVGWPLNLILTEEVMDDYSQVFSFVLQLRLAAWAIEDVYVNLMKLSPKTWHSVNIARHSVYHFVQTLQNYVMNQLLTLAWSEFVAELKKRARSLDDLYEIHLSYIHRAKSRLLLTPKSASLMKIIRDALSLAIKFRSIMVTANYCHTPLLQTQIKAISTKASEYSKFIRLILEKVNDRSHQSHLNELLVKLNFNEFYSS